MTCLEGWGGGGGGADDKKKKKDQPCCSLNDTGRGTATSTLNDDGSVTPELNYTGGEIPPELAPLLQELALILPAPQVTAFAQNLAYSITARATQRTSVRLAVKTGAQAYKGSTVLAHALAKHAGRNPQLWGKMTGSMTTWHGQAMRHFREIIRGPGAFQRVATDGRLQFLEKRLPDGRGIRLNLDGTFKGFVD